MLFIWIKVFYWMRLWQSTAFFLDLMTNTINDINFRAFLCSTFLLVIGGASMFWIFNMSRVSSLEEEESMERIYPQMVGFDFLNAFLFTFL